MKRTTSNDFDESPKRKFRDISENSGEERDSQNDSNKNDRVADYMRELLAEKSALDQKEFSNSLRLLDQEIAQVQNTGKVPPKEYRYANVYRDKPLKISTKVLVPIQEHPKFNFVGKLLGPKGNTLKRLQEETMCKMSILGRGSMKNPEKEEELKNSGDPKYAHLMEDLHVDISAFAPPAEAYARMAFALAEIKKYLMPDRNDNIRMEQLRELVSMGGVQAPRGSYRGQSVLAPRDMEEQFPAPRPPHAMRTATREPVISPRVMPAKAKIMSILDRARFAMEESYNYEEQPSQGYGNYDAPQGSSGRYDEGNFTPSDYYRKNTPAMEYGDAPTHRWKSVPVENPRHVDGNRFRSTSYSRPSHKGLY